jgi:hypothetical protein
MGKRQSKYEVANIAMAKFLVIDHTPTYRAAQIGIANVYFVVSARLRIGEAFEAYGIRPFLTPSTRTSGVINLGCRFLGSAFFNVLQCFPRNAAVADLVSITRSNSHLIPNFVSKMDPAMPVRDTPIWPDS